MFEETLPEQQQRMHTQNTRVHTHSLLSILHGMHAGPTPTVALRATGSTIVQSYTVQPNTPLSCCIIPRRDPAHACAIFQHQLLTLPTAAAAAAHAVVIPDTREAWLLVPAHPPEQRCC